MAMSSYVRLQLRDRRPVSIQIRSSKSCAHLHTVCTTCMDGWARDYTVLAGGHSREVYGLAVLEYLRKVQKERDEAQSNTSA